MKFYTRILLSVAVGLILIGLPLLLITSEEIVFRSDFVRYSAGSFISYKWTKSFAILSLVFGVATIPCFIVDIFVDKRPLTIITTILGLICGAFLLVCGIENPNFTETIKKIGVVLIVIGSMIIVSNIAIILIPVIKTVKAYSSNSTVISPKPAEIEKPVVEKQVETDEDSLKIALRLYKEGKISEEEFITLTKNK